MQRRHKFIWMKGWEQINYTQDGRFDKPKIQKNEKIICRKKKRRYFKKLTFKDIDDYHKEKY